MRKHYDFSKGEKNPYMKLLIVDEEDGEIIFEGTPAEAKEWWWNLLEKHSDVGGYQLCTSNEYKEKFGEE